MKRIGLMSDTHSHLEPSIFDYFKDCDEIWHAGDFGDLQLIERLEAFKPVKGVYGNIDDSSIRAKFPENLWMEVEGMHIFMTHIGGYPGRYKTRVKKIFQERTPDLYICGHSHILKVISDPTYNLLHINPGACGNHGFHQMKTIVRFSIIEGAIKDLQVIELGKRGALK